MTTVHSAGGSPGAGSRDAWRGIINDIFMPADVSWARTGEGFWAEAVSRRLGATEFFRLRERGRRIVERRKDHLKAQSCDAFYLVLPLEGAMSYAHCGHDARLDESCIYLLDGTRPISVRYPAAHSLLKVKIPAAALRSRLAYPEDWCGRAVPACGLTNIVRQTLIATFDNAETVPDANGTELGERVLDLVALGLSGLDVHHHGASVRRAYLQRAKQLIEQALDDVRLSPELIAARLGISVRYLNRIFELAGTSAGRFILERRLALAKRRLISPAFAGIGIAAIAYDLGFGNPAHFSKAFRRLYGCSPSDVRAGFTTRT